MDDGCGDLIAQPAKALALPEHRQHVEDRRRGGPAGERGPQRLRDRAELDPLAFGKGADGLLGGFWRSTVRRRSRSTERSPRRWRVSGVSSAAALSSSGERAVGHNEARTLQQLDQGLGALLQPRHGGDQLAAQRRRQLGGKLGPAGDVRQHALDLGEEIGVGGLAHVVAVEALELGEVEARRRASDLRQIERRDHLLGREDFLVAVAPAEPHQVIAHGGGKVPHRPIGIDAERAVPLGELRAVGAMDERDVRHHRHVPAKRVVDLGLARGIGEMIVAADDVGDAHVVVVHHHREHVGRRAVRAQQHEVVEVLVLPSDPPLHLVLDHGLAGERRLEPEHGLDAGRRLGRIAVAPAPVIELGTALAARFLAHFAELFRARIAAIGQACRQ